MCEVLRDQPAQDWCCRYRYSRLIGRLGLILIPLLPSFRFASLKCLSHPLDYIRWFQSPLRQFGVLPGTVLMNLEGKGGGGSGGIVKLLDMDAREVGALCHNHRMGDTVSRWRDAQLLPVLTFLRDVGLVGVGVSCRCTLS